MKRYTTVCVVGLLLCLGGLVAIVLSEATRGVVQYSPIQDQNTNLSNEKANERETLDKNFRRVVTPAIASVADTPQTPETILGQPAEYHPQKDTQSTEVDKVVQPRVPLQRAHPGDEGEIANLLRQAESITVGKLGSPYTVYLSDQNVLADIVDAVTASLTRCKGNHRMPFEANLHIVLSHGRVLSLGVHAADEPLSHGPKPNHNILRIVMAHTTSSGGESTVGNDFILNDRLFEIVQPILDQVGSVERANKGIIYIVEDIERIPSTQSSLVIEGLNPSGYNLLSRFSELHSLDINFHDYSSGRSTNCNRTVLKHIARLKSLEVVSLVGVSGFEQGALAELVQLPQLNELIIVANGNAKSPAVNDALCAEISSIQSLTRLEIDNSRDLTDYGLELLASLNQLVSLKLDSPRSQRLTGAGLSAWSDHTNLSDIEIRGGQYLTNETFLYLAKLSSLERIALPLSFVIADQSLSDGYAFEQLAGLRELEELDLTNRENISDTSLDDFRLAAPSCTIIR